MPSGGWGPHPVPAMLPPSPRPSRGPLLFGAVAGAIMVAVTAAVLIVSTGSDDEPTAIATESSEPSEDPESEPASSETGAEPTEEATVEGGTYTAVPDLCAIMEPLVAEYMEIDSAQTEVTEMGSAVSCSMAGEFIDSFERPFVTVTQDIDASNPESGPQQYGYNDGVREGCTIEEDVLPAFAESAYFHGDASTGCVILGQAYSAHAADGDMFLSALISFGGEGVRTGGEEQLTIDLIEAVAAAS